MSSDSQRDKALSENEMLLLSRMGSQKLQKIAALMAEKERIDAEIIRLFRSAAEGPEAPAPVAASPARAEEDPIPPVQPAAGKPEAAPSAKGGLSKRGSVTRKLVDLLKSATPAGIEAAELAVKTGKTRSHINNWLSTQGRKIPGFVRVEAGRYRIAVAAENPEAPAET